jgi:geranylgeranyl reductase family protein
MPDYDVIIVGGGPAGSTAARRIAQRNLNVLLLDKAVFPRVKPCAGGMTDRVRNALDFSIDEVVQRRSYGQRVISPSGTIVDCTRPVATGDMLMRDEFDTLLLRKAEEAGAKIREGVKVVNAEQDADKTTVTTSEGERIDAKYLVGADGINSVVARKLKFYKGWPANDAAICIEIEAEVGEEAVERICGVSHDKKGVAVNIYFGPIPFGYIWCFPKKSILSLGAGCMQAKAKNIRGLFNKWFEDFKEKYDIDPKIISDTAARVPYSGAVKKTVIGRTILIGDAAGFVYPFSGEGIVLGVQSAIIAAPVLERAVTNSNPCILAEFEKDWKQAFGSDLKVAKSTADLMFKSEKNMNTILRLAHEDEVIGDIMYKMIAGLDSYKNLQRQQVKRILTKHPLAGLSLYI